MHVLVDTNVILDVLLNREPWVNQAYAVWKAQDQGHLVGYISATTMTDIFYVARRMSGIDTARKAVRLCLETFEICTVDRKTLEYAEKIHGNDFEDNIQIACAYITELNAIVTRDVKGFRNSSVPALTPAEVLEQLGKDIEW